LEDIAHHLPVLPKKKFPLPEKSSEEESDEPIEYENDVRNFIRISRAKSAKKTHKFIHSSSQKF